MHTRVGRVFFLHLTIRNLVVIVPAVYFALRLPVYFRWFDRNRLAL